MVLSFDFVGGGWTPKAIWAYFGSAVTRRFLVSLLVFRYLVLLSSLPCDRPFNSMAPGRQNFSVLFERDPSSDWWVVSIPEVPGCLTQAQDLCTGLERIREALALFKGDEVAEHATFDAKIRQA